MEHFYTDEENTLILISLLKEHGISRVIASPGTTNISFVASVQIDPYFQLFSAFDERSASYMACGLAEETGEPVVLSCTGASASRNYLPGLTEAYYRHLPVLAVTSSQHYGRVGNYVAQVLDRSRQFPDLVKKSCQLYSVNTREDREAAVTSVNDALLELNHGQSGPVHINLFTTYSNHFNVKTLPSYRVIRRITNSDFPAIPKGKIAIWIGAHAPFTSEEISRIDFFCECHNAVVICDQISNYRGKYRFLAQIVNNQEYDFGTRMYDLIIYIGSIHGAYIPFKCKQLWRVNRDGIIRDPYYNCTYVFEMNEVDFFSHYATEPKKNILIESCNKASKQILSKSPVLPFSNLWIASVTSGNIPENAVLHFTILNTLRAWNYFETPESVQCFSNTGAYGIDGGISSFFGSAYISPDIEHYLITGDLAFFYDVNVLFNEIPKNIHILLVNNGVGTEFKNYNHRAAQFGTDADSYIAAKAHNGFGNTEVVKKLCENLEIKYYAATSKEEYLNCYMQWLKKNDGPVLLEVFTNDKDESDALRTMNTIIQDKSLKNLLSKSIVWKIARRMIRR